MLPLRVLDNRNHFSARTRAARYESIWFLVAIVSLTFPNVHIYICPGLLSCITMAQNVNLTIVSVYIHAKASTLTALTGAIIAVEIVQGTEKVDFNKGLDVEFMLTFNRSKMVKGVVGIFPSTYEGVNFDRIYVTSLWFMLITLN